MILIADLVQVCQDAVTNVPAIKTFRALVNPEHLRKHLLDMKQEDFPVLVGVLPSASSKAPDEDNIRWGNHLMFFILKKVNYSGRKHGEELSDYQMLQDATRDVFDLWLQRKMDRESGCSFYNDLDPDQVTIDSEYNFLGCDGWSIAFNLNTKHQQWNTSRQLLPTILDWSSSDF